MKIVACTINPLFPDKVIGGSTKHLRRISIALGEQGHDVVIHCTRRPDSAELMQWHPRVVVKPSFVFKQPFPLPYDVPAFEFARNIQHLVDDLHDADRLYLHDGEFLFPPLCRTIPTIVSLRDCVYPETMLGSFLFEADEMITLTDYCRDSLHATAGRFLRDYPERTTVIHNGFDWDFYKPTPPSEELLRIVGVNPERDTIVLHPHRPEISKGLRQTIETVHRLVHRHRIGNLKILVPSWFDAMQSPELVKYLGRIQRELTDRGLQDVFVFHDWLPQRLMPEYYSLGRVTLVLGNFVEAFGNSAYESLGCGTPAIVSRVSSNRILMPDELLPKVHFDDHDTAAELAANILQAQSRTEPEVQSYLRQHFSVEQQCAAYSRVIVNARKRPPMRYRLTPTHTETRYVLAPWCYTWGNMIYHDYRAEHRQDERLVTLLQEHPEGLTNRDCFEAGATGTQIAEWHERGYLCPAYRTTNQIETHDSGWLCEAVTAEA